MKFHRPATRVGILSLIACTALVGFTHAGELRTFRNTGGKTINASFGYNETTGEIAVSDSWGPHFERRWVPLTVADWASMGSVFMILP